MSEAMRITFVISSLEVGGAERVTSHMANYWAEQGWHVTIVTLAKTAPFYSLHEGVSLKQLGAAHESGNILQAVRNNVRRLYALRHAIGQSEPDVVISMIDRTNVRTLLSLEGSGLPVVVVEQIDPAMHHIGRVWHLLRRLIYGRADAIVVLTQLSRRFFSSRQQSQIHIIPNPVVVNSLPHSGQPDVASHEVIAMGRCAPQKGFDLLLGAWQLVAAGRSQWRLRILGDGPDRMTLTAQAEQMGLADNVRFEGIVTEPERYLRAADLFVMSSRYEGFPMALGEALASGLPAVSFDCPTGPAELIRDGVDGFLVAPEDIKGLAARMALLIDNEPLRMQMAARAPEVVDRFGVSAVMSQWNALLESIRRAHKGVAHG